MTNAPLNATLRNKIKDLLIDAIPNCVVTCWGATDICDLLDNAPNIRVAFPQILGLRDLKELLASVVAKPVLERSTLSIERASELAQVFVPTKAYNKALNILGEHFFSVLTGPPEMGKTTIALIIGLAKLGEGWDCYECKKPDHFFQMFKKEREQVFIADDAFGSTEYRPDIARLWGSDLESILRALDRKHWLIWTSRPAPLHIALERIHLQGRAEDFPNPAQVLVDASDLTQEEKVLILYRHAKAAGLEQTAKQAIKTHARSIVYNVHFTPERIRRLIKDRIAGTIPSQDISSEHPFKIQDAISSELEQPTKAMIQSFRCLEKGHQTFLISLLDCEDGLISENAASKAFERHAHDSDEVGDHQDMAEDLSAHFIRKVVK